MSDSRVRSSSDAHIDSNDVWKDVNSPLLRASAGSSKDNDVYADDDIALTDIESIISKIKSLSSPITGSVNSNTGNMTTNSSQQYFDEINDCTEVLQQKFLLNNKQILTMRSVKLINCNYQVGWIADSDVSDCMLCCTAFGWLKRRHHCRSCGLCVCARCSPNKAEVANLVTGEEGPLSRVCSKCYEFECRGVVSDQRRETNNNVDSNNRLSFATRPLSTDEYISMVRHSNRSGVLHEVYSSIFEKNQALRCERSYRVMRGRIPADISKVTLKVLLSRDKLPPVVAARLWATKALWLIVMHREDIQKLHIADLRGKYAPVGLDLEEQRALWHCLPRWDRSVSCNAEKCEWREGVKAKLDEMLMREALGTLSESERRCVCYRASDESDFCDPAAPLQSRFQRAASQLRAGEESPLGASAAVLPDVQWQGEGMSLIDQVESAADPEEHKALAAECSMALAVCTHVPFSCRLSLAHDLEREGDRDGEREVLRRLQSARKARVPAVKMECRTAEKASLSAKLTAACSPLPARADKENNSNTSNDIATYDVTSLSLSTPSSAAVEGGRASLGGEESSRWDWGSPTSHMKQRKLSGVRAQEELEHPLPASAPVVAAAATRDDSPTSGCESNRASPLSDIDLDNSPIMGAPPLRPYAAAPPGSASQAAFGRRGVATLYFGASANCMMQGFKGTPAAKVPQVLASPMPAKTYNSSHVPFAGGSSGKSPRQRLTPLPDPGPISPDRQTGLLVAAIVSGQAGLVHKYVAEGGYTPLTRAEASNLLLKVVDDPDSLQEPFETIVALVDDLKADINVRDSNGRTPIIALFTDNVLGRFILSRGADILAKDHSGSSALSLSMEFGVDWLLEAYEATGMEAALLLGGDVAAIKEYCANLLYGGYAAKALELMDDKGVVFTAAEIRQVWGVCCNNQDNLKEPAETEALCRAFMQ